MRDAYRLAVKALLGDHDLLVLFSALNCLWNIRFSRVMLDEMLTEDRIRFDKDYRRHSLRSDQRQWLETHPNGTLGEVLGYGRKILDQCLELGEKIIGDGADAPKELADQMEDLPFDLDMEREKSYSTLASFFRRRIWDVESAIEEFGADFRLSDL